MSAQRQIEVNVPEPPVRYDRDNEAALRRALDTFMRTVRDILQDHETRIAALENP